MPNLAMLKAVDRYGAGLARDRWNEAHRVVEYENGRLLERRQILKEFLEYLLKESPFSTPNKYAEDFFKLNETIFKYVSWGLACVALKYSAMLTHSRSLNVMFWILDGYLCVSFTATVVANFVHPFFAAYFKKPKLLIAFTVALWLFLLVVTRLEIDKLVTAAAIAKCAK